MYACSRLSPGRHQDQHQHPWCSGPPKGCTRGRLDLAMIPSSISRICNCYGPCHIFLAPMVIFRQLSLLAPPFPLRALPLRLKFIWGSPLSGNLVSVGFSSISNIKVRYRGLPHARCMRDPRVIQIVAKGHQASPEV